MADDKAPEKLLKLDTQLGAENKEVEIKASTTTELPDLKREVLDSEVLGGNEDFAKGIAAIDTAKEILEQKESLLALESVCQATLLPKIFATGATMDGLSDMSFLDSVNLENLTAIEKLALQKLQEISTTGILKNSYKTDWESLLARSWENYRTSRLAEMVLDGKTNGAEAMNLSVHEKGKMEKVSDWIHRHPWLAGGALVAGSFGLLKWLFSSEEDEEREEAEEKEEKPKKKGFFGKWFDKIFKTAAISAVSTLAVFTLGSMVGKDRIKAWIEKLFGVDSALGSETPEHKSLAEKISAEMGETVSAKTVKNLSNQNYWEFISMGGMLGEWASKVIKDSLPDFIAGDKKQLVEQNVLREYLKKNREKIKEFFPEKKNLRAVTVLDVLRKLNAVAPLPSALSSVAAGTITDKKSASHEEEQDPESSEAADFGKGLLAAMQTGNKDAIGVGKKTVDELREKFSESKAFQKFLKDYEGNWGEALSHPEDFLSDLATACKSSGISIITGAGKIILWNGYEYVTFTTVKSLASTMRTILTAPFSDDVNFGDAVIDYAEGIPAFMAVGGIVGLITKGKEVSKIRALLGGMARGAVFPIEVAKLHARGGQYVYRGARGMSYDVGRYLAQTPELKKEILENQARFYGRIVQHYDEVVDLYENGSWYEKPKTIFKTSKIHAEKLRAHYLKKFLKVHEKITGKKTSMTDLGTAVDEMNNWLSEAGEAKATVVSKIPKAPITPEISAQLDKIRKITADSSKLNITDDALSHYATLANEGDDVDELARKILHEWNIADKTNYFDNPEKISHAKAYAEHAVEFKKFSTTAMSAKKWWYITRIKDPAKLKNALQNSGLADKFTNLDDAVDAIRKGANSPEKLQKYLREGATIKLGKVTFLFKAGVLLGVLGTTAEAIQVFINLKKAHEAEKTNPELSANYVAKAKLHGFVAFTTAVPTGLGIAGWILAGKGAASAVTLIGGSAVTGAVVALAVAPTIAIEGILESREFEKRNKQDWLKEYEQRYDELYHEWLTTSDYWLGEGSALDAIFTSRTTEELLKEKPKTRVEILGAILLYEFPAADYTEEDRKIAFKVIEKKIGENIEIRSQNEGRRVIEDAKDFVSICKIAKEDPNILPGDGETTRFAQMIEVAKNNGSMLDFIDGLRGHHISVMLQKVRVEGQGYTSENLQKEKDLELSQAKNVTEYAIYKVAQYFGYVGPVNLDLLKEHFFTSAEKGIHGIYWDGKEWVVTEIGLESDNEVGSDGKESLLEIAKQMREEYDDIFGRRDNSFLNGRIEKDPTFKVQATELAKLIETAIADYESYSH